VQQSHRRGAPDPPVCIEYKPRRTIIGNPKISASALDHPSNGLVGRASVLLDPGTLGIVSVLIGTTVH